MLNIIGYYILLDYILNAHSRGFQEDFNLDRANNFRRTLYIALHRSVPRASCRT